VVNPFQSRTDAKSIYARINLQEITSRPERGSADDFERAHEESCLFHIVGTKDAFLQEINEAYKLGVPVRRVNEETLSRKLKQQGFVSPALAEIKGLESNEDSWLAIAIELRNHGTHRSHIPRKFDVGGEENGRVVFQNPLTGTYMEETISEFLTTCLHNMTALLQKLRATLP